MANIYTVTAHTKGQTHSVLVAGMADAVHTARRFMGEHRAHYRSNWEDRSPALYGNQGKAEASWTVRLWRNRDEPLEEVTIAPVTVHSGTMGWSLLIAK